MELLKIAKSKRLSQQQAEASVKPLTILQAEDGADSLGVLTSRCEEVSFPLAREDRATLQSMEALLFKLGNEMATETLMTRFLYIFYTSRWSWSCGTPSGC